MRHSLVVLSLFGFAGAAFAQEKDVKTVKTTTTTTTKTTKVVSQYDLNTTLWQFTDAVPVTCGTLNLRLNYHYITAGAPANRGDSNDDHIVTPSIAWGVRDNLEVDADLPMWLGDSGDKPGGVNGNFDTNVGILWRFLEQQSEWIPAMALGVSTRIPTGDNSSHFDLTGTLAMTNEYSSGLRSHLNFWGKSANGGNNNGFTDDNGRVYGDERDFQYGAVAGLDGPLGDAARWIVDYQWRIGQYDGTGSGSNILELGWEYNLNEANRIGMSYQIGLDDNDDTPNFGSIFSFSHAIMF